MMTDALLQLATAQVVTTAAVSTNTIDLSVARDMGPGTQLYAVITVDVAATAAGAATVDFQVITSAAANLSTPTIIGTTGPLAKTELTIGRKPIVVPIPSAVLLAQPIGKRYLGLQFAIGTGPLTAGSFSVAITDSDVSSGKNYPAGYTVN